MSEINSTNRVTKKTRHFYYKISHKPWFGPVKKAGIALSGVQIQPLMEEGFLDYLQENYQEIYRELTYVDFYQFQDLTRQKQPNSKEYRIAVCYLRPDPNERDALYLLREEITHSTGWYPLVMGEKAKFTIGKDKLPRHREDTKAVLASANIGNLRRIRPVVPGDKGSAFLIEGTGGSLLLDTGMEIVNPLPANLKAAFLTHFHHDHSGGVINALDSSKILFLSEPTLRYLYVKSNHDKDFQQKLLSSALVIEKISKELQTNPGFRAFPVFHAPGSYGFSLHDVEGNCLIYPGDLCLKNGFLDTSTEQLNHINSIDASRKWVLVDAAMASRESVEISAEDTPEHIIDEMVRDLTSRNAIFCSQSVETLIYEYILAFVRTRASGDEKAIKLFVPDSLFRLAQSLLGPMVYRSYDQIDPFVESVIGKNVTNFVESHRVYPLRCLAEIPAEEHVIIFATPRDIENQSNIQKRIFGGNMILAGTLALRPEDVPAVIDAAKPRTILRVASPDWSFHSSEEDLVNFISQLSQRGINTILFHDFSRRLDKLIRKHHLDANRVRTISSDGIRLD